MSSIDEDMVLAHFIVSEERRAFAAVLHRVQ